eukprot:GHVT01043016.1.p1 GENE.GHVT01043016.1~~GHVT01043016.1.p1  ORF type:complete len:201 (-),score=11.09 GHVT01043016.1:152-754(-)
MPYGTVTLGDTEGDFHHPDAKYFRISLGLFTTSVKTDNIHNAEELDEAEQVEQHSTFFEVKIYSGDAGNTMRLDSRIESWTVETGGMVVDNNAVPLMTEFCLGISTIKDYSVFDHIKLSKNLFNQVRIKQQEYDSKLASNNVKELDLKISKAMAQYIVEEFAQSMWAMKLELQARMYETKCAKNEGTEANLILLEPIGKT